MTATRTAGPDVTATLPTDLHTVTTAEFDAAHLAAEVGIVGARVVDTVEWQALPEPRQVLVLVGGHLTHLALPEVVQ